METKIYSQDGKEVGKVTLPESIFGLPWNADLVHQVVISMQGNARTPVAHTHDRSEQRGGGKKPWRQKGTGRARHGSRRSPIWRGGGVTFGPRNEKDYSKKINKKMRAKALFTVLSRKLKDNEVLFVDGLSFSEPKTRDAKLVVSTLGKLKGFETLSTKKKNSALITLPEKNEVVSKSFRNINSFLLDEVRNLNPVDVLSYKYLVITNPSSSLPILEARKGVVKKAEKKAVATTKEKASAPKKSTKATKVVSKVTKKVSTKKKTTK